jgi:HAD superfamily hydrolase (TIGR01509 family)
MDKERNKWGAIFDVDGTMVSNTAYHRQAWYDLCAKYGIPMDHESYHAKIHARSNDKIVPNLFGPNVDEAFIRKIENEKETLYQDLFRPVMRETPGLTALLTALNEAGIPCGAASNSPKSNVDFVLDGLGIRHLFSTVYCRDDVSVGKPDPELLLKTAASLNLPPHRCLVFEDSSSGFAAARAAGMPYVVITAGGDPSELTQAYDARLICEDFTSLTPDKLAALMDGCPIH